jgi:hypothetical protein
MLCSFLKAKKKSYHDEKKTEIRQQEDRKQKIINNGQPASFVQSFNTTTDKIKCKNF